MNNYIVSQILDCWFLDVEFLDNLIDEFDVDLDIEEIKKEFWLINLNLLVYKVYDEVKNRFLTDYKQEVEEITWNSLENVWDFEDYEIFTNYLDSHLWFNNEKIEDLFQLWRSRNSSKNYDY
jgi:hypothetical protein